MTCIYLTIPNVNNTLRVCADLRVMGHEHDCHALVFVQVFKDAHDLVT